MMAQRIDLLRSQETTTAITVPSPKLLVLALEIVSGLILITPSKAVRMKTQHIRIQGAAEAGTTKYDVF